MGNWINDALGTMQQSKPLLGICLILAVGLGCVLTSLGGTLKEIWRDRRNRKRNEEAEYEAQRIRHGWDEENSDEWSLTNETYHDAAPRQQRSLNREWRQRVREAAEPTMMNPVLSPSYPVVPVYQAPEWPTWTEQELASGEGRRRRDDDAVFDAMPVSPGQGYTPRQLRALVQQTGTYSKIDNKELIGVGYR